ncbi:MAG: hypothetical protein GY902_13450, partial [Planctomycetes bacterium]|nr:hypothetical protein [Planctomycetota bacterium]
TVNFFSLLIDNNFYSNELTYGVTPLVGGALATLSIVSAFIPARMSGMTVYTQAADLTTSTLTNSLALPIL